MRTSLILIALSVSWGKAQAQGVPNAALDVLVDGGNDFTWEKVELPKAVCGDGSQYKFFVHRTRSPNLLFFFEGGGACWDFDTCSGRAGVLGAANPNGLPDDYMQRTKAKYVSPIVNGADPGLPLRARTNLPTRGWNVVFLPYCTGDVHIGNSVTVYRDPGGKEPPLTWHHAGYPNTVAVIGWVRGQFPAIEKLLVSGFSAGGTAATAAYHFVRRGLKARWSYLLNDSGPIHFAGNASAPSRPLHEQIRRAWSLDTVFDQFPAPFDRNDLGTINAMLAQEFPEDQLAYTGFLSDYDFSRFSYQRFANPHDRDTILRTWREDQRRLFAALQPMRNTSVFVGYERPINASHCSTIITFVGSHACADVEKKRHPWEYLEPPPGQTWKCYTEMVAMAGFLDRLVVRGVRTQIVEPPNAYNEQDPGMRLLAPLINAAIGP